MSAIITLDQPYVPDEPGHVHIDFFKCVGPLAHEPLGKTFFIHDPLMGMVPAGASAIKPRRPVGNTGAEPYLRSHKLGGQDGLAQELEISCCPGNVLQGHNVFGHGVLGDYVLDIFDREVEKHQIDVSLDDRELWDSGLVQIHEVHLTANFWFDGDKLALFDLIDGRFQKSKQRPDKMWITLGGALKRSAHHMLTIYCKHEQLKKLWSEVGPLKTQLLALAGQTIRVELKLYRAGLLARGLGTLRSWRAVDLDPLFFETMAKYNLAGAVQKQVPLHVAEKALAKPYLRTYIAWQAGQEIELLYSSRATVLTHRKAILEAIGVDVSMRYCPDMDEALDLSHIFTPENIMALPGGALREERYHPPRQS